MKYYTCTYCQFFAMRKTKGGGTDPLRLYCKLKNKSRKDKDKVCKFFLSIPDCEYLETPDYCIFEKARYKYHYFT